jgi:hypothetical protein
LDALVAIFLAALLLAVASLSLLVGSQAIKPPTRYWPASTRRLSDFSQPHVLRIAPAFLASLATRRLSSTPKLRRLELDGRRAVSFMY